MLLKPSFRISNILESVKKEGVVSLASSKKVALFKFHFGLNRPNFPPKFKFNLNETEAQSQ